MAHPNKYLHIKETKNIDKNTGKAVNPTYV